MLRQDRLQIIDTRGKIEFYVLPPGGVTYIGRHPDNQIILDSPGVAPFQAILDHRQKPYHILLLSQTEPVTVGPELLPPGAPYPLPDGSIIQLETYTLILLEDKSVPDPDPTIRLPAMSGAAFLEYHQTVQEKQSASGQPSLTETGRPAQLRRAAGNNKMGRFSWPYSFSRLGQGLVWLVTLSLVGLVIFTTHLMITRFQMETKPAEWNQSPASVQAGQSGVMVAPKFQQPVELAPAPFQLPGESGDRPENYEQMFQEIASQYELDWRLLAELAYQESRMNPLAVGRHHDMGLMQIIPSTWNEWAPKVNVSDPFEPYSNVLVGAVYLAYVRDYCRARGYPEVYWMLVGYNWGPDNLRHLFESNGGWADVPAKQRQYALEILQATSNQTSRWQESLVEVGLTTY